MEEICSSLLKALALSLLEIEVLLPELFVDGQWRDVEDVDPCRVLEVIKDTLGPLKLLPKMIQYVNSCRSTLNLPGAIGKCLDEVMAMCGDGFIEDGMLRINIWETYVQLKIRLQQNSRNKVSSFTDTYELPTLIRVETPWPDPKACCQIEIFTFGCHEH